MKGLFPSSIPFASCSDKSPASTFARRNLTFPSFGRVGLAFGVGHDEYSVAAVRGANGSRWDTIPFCIVPALGQLPEYS